MDNEKIEEIYKEFEDYDRGDVKNEIVKGLNILAKYSDDVSINPAHDELFAGLDEAELEKMTEEDVREMFKLGWMWNEDSFSIFC